MKDCFFPPYVFFFSATKLLHKVCLKTNTENYLLKEERNTVIIQSIVLFFWCTKGLYMWDSNMGEYNYYNKSEFYI